MVRALTGHSRLVYWLKVTLPVIALAILSTLFLLARHVDFDGDLPFARVELDRMANDPRLTNPEFSTMTADGAAIRVAADVARPGAATGDPVTLERPVAVYQPKSTNRLSLAADGGVYDGTGGQMTMDGHVLIATADGYRMTAARLVASLTATDLVADGPVVTDGPMGRIDAGGLRLTDVAGTNHLVFNGGVKLVYKTKN